MVSTWQPNAITATSMTEVREEEGVQRLEKMKGKMSGRFGVKAVLGDVTMVIAQNTNGMRDGNQMQ